MKQKTHARQKREEEARRRKGAFSPKAETKPPAGNEPPEEPKPVFRPERFPDRSPEEETREFLAYLDRYGTAAAKEDLPRAPQRKSGPAAALPRLNLEEGMPLAEEAVSRMRMGLQELRVSRAKAVKLIHGYGSTGRGGRIRAAVREELAALKRKKQIRAFIPGEDFGPLDAAARELAERNREITRDPDYGRMNPGITIVVL